MVGVALIGLLRLAATVSWHQLQHSLIWLPRAGVDVFGVYAVALLVQLVVAGGAVWLHQTAARGWQRRVVAILALTPAVLSDVVVAILLVTAVTPQGWFNIGLAWLGSLLGIDPLSGHTAAPPSHVTPPWPWLSPTRWYLILLALADAWRGWPVFWLLWVRASHQQGWWRQTEEVQQTLTPVTAGTERPVRLSRWSDPSWRRALMAGLALRLAETLQLFTVSIMWLGPGLFPTWAERIGTYARTLDTVGLAAIWTLMLLIMMSVPAAWLLLMQGASDPGGSWVILPAHRSGGGI